MKPFSLFLYIILAVIIAGFYSFKPADEHIVLAQDVFKETNLYRKSNGLQSLEMIASLNAIAQKHSVDMAGGKSSFGHDGFDTRNVQAMKTMPGIRAFAENVALDARSAQAVLVLWKNSAGHRRNLLGSFKYIGIGIAKDKHGRIYYTQIFAG